MCVYGESRAKSIERLALAKYEKAMGAPSYQEGKSTFLRVILVWQFQKRKYPTKKTKIRQLILLLENSFGIIYNG